MKNSFPVCLEKIIKGIPENEFIFAAVPLANLLTFVHCVEVVLIAPTTSVGESLNKKTVENNIWSGNQPVLMKSTGVLVFMKGLWQQSRT